MRACMFRLLWQKSREHAITTGGSELRHRECQPPCSRDASRGREGPLRLQSLPTSIRSLTCIRAAGCDGHHRIVDCGVDEVQASGTSGQRRSVSEWFARRARRNPEWMSLRVRLFSDPKQSVQLHCDYRTQLQTHMTASSWRHTLE